MVMSHKNLKDIEASLNACSVLIELIETEKTFQIFLSKNGELTRLLLSLAVDPSNSFNQQYLLQVLLALSKQLRPGANQQNVFKDMEEESQKGFDPETQSGKNIMLFLKIVKEEEILHNLLILINTINTQQSYVNQ